MLNAAGVESTHKESVRRATVFLWVLVSATIVHELIFPWTKTVIASGLGLIHAIMWTSLRGQDPTKKDFIGFDHRTFWVHCSLIHANYTRPPRASCTRGGLWAFARWVNRLMSWGWWKLQLQRLLGRMASTASCLGKQKVSRRYQNFPKVTGATRTAIEPHSNLPWRVRVKSVWFLNLAYDSANYQGTRSKKPGFILQVETGASCQVPRWVTTAAKGFMSRAGLEPSVAFLGNDY